MFKKIDSLAKNIKKAISLLSDGNKSTDLLNANLEKLTKSLEEHNKLVLWELKENRKRMDIVWHASTAKIYEEINEYLVKKQLSMEETLKTIASEKKSFARFGDGELKLMLRSDYNLKFQKNSDSLQRDLRDCLNKKVDNLLIGFPNVYHDLHWANVYADIWYEIKPMIEQYSVFGHAHVSRPLFFQIMGEKGVELWRNVWDGTSVKIITGKESRFSAIDPLFDNTKSVSYEYSMPANAYDDIDRLINVINTDNETELFLVALGPAGTILTHKMAELGKWVIDIGHINSSYENVFEDALWPEKLEVTIKK